MLAEKIIESLHICEGIYRDGPCWKCWYRRQHGIGGGCVCALHRDAVLLTRRLKERGDRLKDDLNAVLEEIREEENEA